MYYMLTRAYAWSSASCGCIGLAGEVGDGGFDPHRTCPRSDAGFRDLLDEVSTACGNATEVPFGSRETEDESLDRSAAKESPAGQHDGKVLEFLGARAGNPDDVRAFRCESDHDRREGTVCDDMPFDDFSERRPRVVEVRNLSVPG